MNNINTVHSSIDFEKIRDDFPVLSQKINGSPLVYLDNAATSQKPIRVIETINDYYRQYNSNIHRGVHTLSQKATEAYETAREKIKTFINANSEKEIIFVRGATEALNLVSQSYGRAKLTSGDEILITEMEHHSNIVPWQILSQQTGIKLKYIPIDDDGELVLEEFEKLLNEKTKLVSLIHVSNSLGTINPIKNIIEKAHSYGAKVIIDGAQAIPHINVNVKELDCDFYVFSSHKLYGPTGIGVLYGKEQILENMPPYQGGGDMIKTVSMKKSTYNELPNKFEAGTPPIAEAIGLGTAIDYLTDIGFDSIAKHENALLKYATKKANLIDGLKIIGNAKNKASIVSFTLDGVHPHDIATILDNDGIAIRAGHHCTMPIMERYSIAATSRASFAFYNTYDDIDSLFTAIDKCKKVFS